MPNKGERCWNSKESCHRIHQRHQQRGVISLFSVVVFIIEKCSLQDCSKIWLGSHQLPFAKMENGAWSKMGLDQALGLKKKKNSAKYSDPGCHCSCNLDFSGSGWAPNETNFSKKKKPAGEGLFPASPNFLSERKKQTSSTVALR